MRTIQGDITAVLIDGLAQLIQQGKRRNYWCSSRATADALIALDHSLPLGEYPHLQNDALRVLLRESDVNESRRNWNGEVWDTSVAVLALRNLQGSKYQTALIQSRDWLLSKYLRSHFWNHEQWETLWALIALSRLPDPPTHIDFSPALQWILDAMGKPSGMLMNWSNTALFILFTNQTYWEYPRAIKTSIDRARDKCLQTILNEPLDADDSGETLWTPEGWSNGLVIWALAEAQGKLPKDGNDDKIINWCKSKISAGELFEEDLAFICIGLYEYLKRLYLAESKSKELELKVQLAKQLKMVVMDKPRAITKHTYDGYWSVHLSHGVVRFALYLIISGFFSALILFSENKLGEWTSWIALVPGIVALIVTFADFGQILPWSKRARAADNNEEVE